MVIDIRLLQQRLNDLGFGPLVVDGIKGPRTDAAVVAFKRSVGLRARPYVGPITWSALMEEPTGSEIPWLAEAIRIHGLHEQRDYSKLRKWFDKSVAWIDPREIPWCGAFIATALRKWNPGVALPENPLLAKNWKKFGMEAAPGLGAILTFHRGSPASWKGHVAFYLGETDDSYYVLGGNQSDAVTKTWIKKNRFHSSRWPVDFPQNGKRIMLDRRGRPISRNEA